MGLVWAVCCSCECIASCSHFPQDLCIHDQFALLSPSFLLDQLMRYEAVVLSGGEETDYSSGEDTAQPLPSSETLVRHLDNGAFVVLNILLLFPLVEI